MSTHEEHIDLFDRYLRGQLSTPERESFEKRLAGDQVFADDFKVHKILALGIRDHGRQELKAYLKEHGKKLDGGFNPRMRRMSFAVAASIILLVGIFVVVNFYITSPRSPDLALQKEPSKVVPEAPAMRQDTNSDNKFAEADNAIPDKSETKMKESVVSADEALPPPIVEHEEMPRSIEMTPGPVKGYYSTSQNGASVDFDYVNTEKKLKDTLMTAELLFGDLAALDDFNRYESKSLSKAEVQLAPANVTMSKKKNGRAHKSESPSTPSNQVNNNVQNALDTVKFADVITDQKTAKDKDVSQEQSTLYNNNQSKRSLHVEFWQSPLNFKGYKYTGNTLYLYGVNQPGLKLYIYKDKTYLRNNGQVYILEPCENGCPFKEVDDKQITEFILKQP